MCKYRIVGPALILLLVVCARAEDLTKPEYRLLAPGQSGVTCDAKSGQRWLGLFRETDGYSLRLTKIEKKLVREEMYDPPEGPFTNQIISTPDEKVPPIFMIKGPLMRERDSIPTVLERKVSLHIGKRRFQSKHGTFIELDITGRTDAQSGNIVDYQLQVTGNGKKVAPQIIEASPWVYNLPTLYWVGDLDGDGLLDMFIGSASGEGGGSGAELYLSSAAKEDEVLHKVAEIVFGWGC